LVLAASAGSVSFFGIPIARALFGPDEARVAVYFAMLNVPLALLSAAIISGRIEAARAGGGPAISRLASIRIVCRSSARQFLTTPATWALIAGLALNNLSLGETGEAALHAVASTVAPTTMFALGLGLRFARTLEPYRMALPAVAIKLAVSPLVVLACAYAIGLSGLPLAIVALQGAMPTQVLSVVIAEKYRLDSRTVGLTLAMDTAIAFLFLPVLIGVIAANLPV
jgi:predicted permease